MNSRTRLILIVVAILIVLGLSVAGIVWLRNRDTGLPPANSAPVSSTTPTPTPSSTPTAEQQAIIDELKKAPADTDGDMLPDDQEAAHGTDPNNPDTDGDGYSDGAEVKAGYNPNGPGKLPQ